MKTVTSNIEWDLKVSDAPMQEKQLKHKETSCNRITQERNSARKALLELYNLKEAKVKELEAAVEVRDRDLTAFKQASNTELQQKESAVQVSARIFSRIHSHAAYVAGSLCIKS